jgi:hypothetical protein
VRYAKRDGHDLNRQHPDMTLLTVGVALEGRIDL